MTYKERMLKVLKGEAVDRIPYVPRLDLWYNANKRNGTLPSKYANASLMDIAKEEDFGFHAILPNFKDLRNAEDEIHRGLGIYNLWTMPCKTIFENIEVKTTVEGDKTIVDYITPVGSIRTAVIHDESMKKAGISISHLAEYAIKNHTDYKAICYIFDNTRVEPNYDTFNEFYDYVGDQGLAAAFITLAGSPMHLLQRELLPFDLFSYELFDHPDELKECADSIGRLFKKLFDVSMGCSAEIIFNGANYDAMLTYPPFFNEHITPWLQEISDLSHKKGKYFLTHTDGENTGLLDYYLDTRMDIADSICPKPMTKLTFKEVRDVFDNKITILGGIPSIAFVKESMSDYEFDKYIAEFFENIDEGKRLILGISDTTPPGAEFDRLRKVGELCKQFGPIAAL